MDIPTDESITEEDLFAAAMDLPAEQQAAYLESACPDPELKERVRKLLSLHHQTGFMAPLEQTDGLDHIRHRPALRPERPGDLIGRYKLVEVLGDGGFGVVWLAEQKAPVQREVALKIIRLGMDTEEVLTRFEQERQALALMDHPNIAKVYDAGTTSTGRPYFVMELVRGMKITEYCDAHRLSTPERLKLATMICHALQHAHQKGIIHRDLKPSNILVTDQDGRPLPKVIDFGVAKAVDQRLTERTLITKIQQVVGTPMYMSPEQAEGGSLDVDTRSDIYSFGVVLYELLTGCPLIDPHEARKGLEEMRRKLFQDVRKPSTALSSLNAEALRETAERRSSEASRLVHAIRGDLDWIVMKCLEKDRARRYETATELGMDLQRHLEDRPVLARPPTKAYLLGRFMSRHRLGVAAGTVVALSVIGGLTASMVLLMKEKAASHRAVTAEALSEERAVTASEAAQRYRQGSYVSDMLLVQSAIQESNLGRAHDLLEANIPLGGQEDIRGLEWRMLWNDAKPEMLKKFEHGTIVSSVSLSPDGRLAATCCYDEKVRLWDTESSKAIAEFPWRSSDDVEAMQQVHFSPNGKWLALARHGRIELRQAPRWNVVQTLPQVDAPCAFSLDSKLLATRSTKDGRSLIVWDTDTWQTTSGVFLWSSTSGQRLAWARDSLHIYLSSPASHNGLSRWNVAEPKEPPALFDAVNITSLAVSPKGNWVATGGGPGYISLFDPITQERVCHFDANKSWLLGLAFSPDGKRLVSGGGDQMLRYWDVTKKPVNGQLLSLGASQGHRSEIWGLSFSRDGQRLLSAGKDGIAGLWAGVPQTASTRFILRPPGFTLIGFSDAERSLQAFVPPRSVTQWDLATAKMISQLELPEPPAEEAVLSLSNGSLVYGTRDGYLKILPSANLAQCISTKLGPRAVVPLAAAPDGSVLAIQNGTDCQIVDAKDGHKIANVADYHRLGDRYFKVAVFSPDSRILAFTSSSSRIGLWDVKQSRPERMCEGGGWRTYSMAFSPDGRLLAGSSWDGQIRIWETSTGKSPLPSLRGHSTGVGRVQFSPDGRTLLSTGDDRRLNFWNVATGRLVMSDDRKGTMSEPSIFSPSGRFFVLSDNKMRDRLNILEIPSLAEIDSGHTASVLPLPSSEPKSAGDLARTADDQVRHGKFALAIESYEKCMELDPKTDFFGDRQSVVLAFHGNPGRWKAVVMKNLARAKGTADVRSAMRAAKDSLLLASADAGMLEEASQLLVTALGPEGQKHSVYPMSRLMKALYDYRRADYASCAKLARELAEKATDKEFAMTAQAIQTMALHRVGAPERDAPQTQATLKTFYESLPLPEEHDPGKAWHDVLVCATILREAIATLEQPKGP